VATDDTFETIVASGEATARAERDYTVKSTLRASRRAHATAIDSWPMA
jgi:hypothetical protein